MIKPCRAPRRARTCVLRPRDWCAVIRLNLRTLLGYPADTGRCARAALSLPIHNGTIGDAAARLG
jgi:hypothetical protein